MPQPITPADFPGTRWRGSWIWLADEPNPFGSPFGETPVSKPDAHALFRKCFMVERVPTRVPARITADSRYVMFVNGREVSRGPLRSQPRRQHYDLFDLAPYLHKGQNVIAVYVKHFGGVRSYYMPAAPNGSLGRSGVLVFEADLGKAGWLTSDATWRALRSPGHAKEGGDGQTIALDVGGGVPTELFDARRLTTDWPAIAFDDNSWPLARVITPVHLGGRGRAQPPTDPYGALLPNPLAPLGGETVAPTRAAVAVIDAPPDATKHSPSGRVEASLLAHPGATALDQSSAIGVPIPPGGHSRIELDMGRIVVGLVSFTIDAPAGTVFDFFYAEDPVTAPNMFGAHGGNRYIARGDADTHTTFDPKGFRHAYVIVYGAAGSATLQSLSVREHLYPWQPGASFRSSDPELNRLYDAGIRTVRCCSWDAFIDCPTREQRAWVGDSVVHQMVLLATNTDWRLAWHALELGNSPRGDGILPMSVGGDVEYNAGTTIPDWSLHWIHSVYNLYRFTGDRALVKSYMPTIERILRWFLPYRGANGLLRNVVEWNLIDWSTLYSDGLSSIVNAGWARGLREFAELAGWLGERASQRWARELHSDVKRAFEIFWDDARGVYVDQVSQDNGARLPATNQLGGALAILAGLAPRKRWKRMIETLTDERTLVVRSVVQPPRGSVTPAERQLGGQHLMMGYGPPNWDAEREIVIAQPFMSYVVHDAVVEAGMADRLPALHKRWVGFLTDGFDTIGECWDAGTHVHGWSCAPTRDLVFYTLGVTPAEPGYGVARIAPRLGSLRWAKGAVPTPHGLIKVEITDKRVRIDSPVPVQLDLPGRKTRALRAGKHEIALA